MFYGIVATSYCGCFKLRPVQSLDLFPFFQRQELKTIFSNVRRHYLLEERRLRDAQRRYKADDLRAFLP